MPYRRTVKATGATLVFDGAEKLKGLLSDGRRHAVVLELSYLKSKDDELPLASWMIEEGWRSLSDDEVAEQQRRRQAAMGAWLDPGKADADRLGACCDAMNGMLAGKSTEPIPPDSDWAKLSAPMARLLLVRARTACVTHVSEVRSGEIKLASAARDPVLASVPLAACHALIAKD